MVLPVLVFATNGSNIGFDNPISGVKDVYTLITKVTDFALKIGSVIVVLFIIYSGFLFVSAQGKPDKLKTARETFFWAIVGAMIILGANVLSKVVCTTVKSLGADLSGVCS